MKKKLKFPANVDFCKKACPYWAASVKVRCDLCPIHESNREEVENIEGE